MYFARIKYVSQICKALKKLIQNYMHFILINLTNFATEYKKKTKMISKQFEEYWSFQYFPRKETDFRVNANNHKNLKEFLFERTRTLCH